MGILANTVSFCQYRVVGTPPVGDPAVWAGEALAKGGFRSIDGSAEELSVGWVALDDPRDASFSFEPVFRRDHYLTFSLRRDQRRIPGALLRAHLEAAENEFLAAHPGLQRVPRQKREELREAVRGALFAKTLPAPAVYDAVWDTRRGVVSFASLSPKVLELFENLFKQCFEGLRLVPIHPFARAEAVTPEALQPALQAANGASNDAVLDLIRDNQWLGADFLLWLLYRTLNADARYRVSQDGPALEGTEFIAYLNDRLVLLGGGESGVQKVTVAGPQDNFSEVRTALLGGKQISEAILYLEQNENLWKTTLKGGMFQFASFKAPAVRIERDQRTDENAERVAVFYERMAVLEEGLQLFDSLLADFLQVRLGAEWPEWRGRLDAWLNP